MCTHEPWTQNQHSFKHYTCSKRLMNRFRLQTTRKSAEYPIISILYCTSQKTCDTISLYHLSPQLRSFVLHNIELAILIFKENIRHLLPAAAPTYSDVKLSVMFSENSPAETMFDWPFRPLLQRYCYITQIFINYQYFRFLFIFSAFILVNVLVIWLFLSYLLVTVFLKYTYIFY